MSTVTTVTSKPQKPVRFTGTLGQFRTLKNGKVTVALTAPADQLKKIVDLVAACSAGNALALSAQVIPQKKDAKEKHTSKNKKRVARYPYRDQRE